MFYTYAHYTADTNEIFYIGKGKGRRVNQYKGRNDWWSKKAKKHGFVAKILSYWDTEEDALSHEKLLIGCFKDMGIELVNLTDGGEGLSGYKHTLEAKEKIGKAFKGRRYSPETLEKMSKAQKGCVKSPEAIEKMRITKTGAENPKKWKPVLCKTTGVSYPSVKEAASQTGCGRSHIVACCKGKLKQTKRLEFKYDNP